MFKLQRLLDVACILLLNLLVVTSSFYDLIKLLRTVDANRIECVHHISKSGVYTFNWNPRIPLSQCDVTIEIPEETIAYVTPSKETCKTTSSASISAMCRRPHQEEQFPTGLQHILFESSESITISVHFTPVFRLECEEYAKNIYNLVGHTIVLENTLPTRSNKYCMIQMPASLEITWMNYETTNRRKPCCPDVFVASTNFKQSPVGYSESFNACDLRANRETYITRCEMTYIYLRQSAKHDKIAFRIVPRQKKHIDECIPVIEEMEPSNFTCIKKPKQNRSLFRSNFGSF